MRTFNTVSKGYRALLLLGSASTFAIAGPAFAQSEAQEPITSDAPQQSQPQAQQGSTIIVTGSRIARRDFTATSPILTVDSSMLEDTSSVALENNLNQLPQFTPAQTQFVNYDIQPSAVNTVGAATVSLRNLGANRNLVLIDGRRGTPINASGVIDINSIPSAMVERVEVITGGASSTYGADAVGGVVNFILRNNFQGLEIDGQGSMTERGDGFEYRISAVTGASFDDGRGNVMLGVEHFDRNAVYQRDRDFYRDLWADPESAGTRFFANFTSYNPGTNPAGSEPFPGGANVPDQSVVEGLFAGGPVIHDAYGNSPSFLCVPLASLGNLCPSFFFNDDGTIFTGAQNFNQIPSLSLGGAWRYNGPVDGFNTKRTGEYYDENGNPAGYVANNITDQYLSSPATRWSFFAKSTYEITDDISFFSQAYFAKSHVLSSGDYSPAYAAPWAAFIPHGDGIYTGNSALGIPSSLNGDGTTNANYQAGGAYGLNCGPVGGCTNNQVFPVPDELALLLDSRPNPDAPWSLSTVTDELGERRTVNDNYTFQILAGFNGKLPINDWTWELYGSHGETRGKTNLYGFGSRERWRALAALPNYGQGAQIIGNDTPPFQGQFGGTASCTSGLHPFTPGDWSEDCKDAIGVTLQNDTNMIQDIVEGSVQGGLFQLPYGDLRFALGADYRRQKFSFLTDSLSRNGSSFLDSVIGVFPQGNAEGRTTTKEVFGELLVPVLEGVPFFQSLSLELGARYSDNDPSGGVWTYKINGDWAVTDWLRFRGGYQRASRAPNIGELYQSDTQTLAFTSGDPCSTLTLLPYGANPGQATSPEQAAGTRSICETLMGAGAGAFYSGVPGSGGLVQDGFGLALPILNGNPDLKAEDAKTWTLGAVISVPGTSPLTSRLRASVDYYNIKITDAITPQGVSNVEQYCYGQEQNPTFDPNAPACKQIIRNQISGVADQTFVTYVNTGGLETAGIDVNIDWGVDFGDIGAGLPGGLALNFVGNWLDYYRTASDVSLNPLVDYTGLVGNPEWRTFTTLSYVNGGFNIGIRWQHTPSMISTARVNTTTGEAIEACNGPSRDPGPGVTPCTNNSGVESYDLFGLNGSYALTDNLSIRFGVDNLFDKDPPLVDRNYDPDTPSNPTALMGGSYNANAYDALGRRYYVGAKVKF